MKCVFMSFSGQFKIAFFSKVNLEKSRLFVLNEFNSGKSIMKQNFKYVEGYLKI